MLTHMFMYVSFLIFIKSYNGDMEFKNINNLKVKNYDGPITKGCLVLEGGALRGIYTSGVLDYFLEKGLNIENVYGVSAGALTGTNYIAGAFGRSAMLILKYRFNKRYVGLDALKESGSVMGFKFMFEDLAKEYPLNESKVFTDKRNLYAVATNVKTGQAEYFSNHEDRDTFYNAIKASASMPLVSKMVKINDDYYLDGGIATKIPIRKALEDKQEKIIFIGTRESDYRRKPTSKELDLAKVVYKKYPLFINAYENANINYNEDCDMIDTLVLQKKIYSITPSKPVTISRIEDDLDKLSDLYYLGYFDAMEHYDNVIAYLNN